MTLGRFLFGGMNLTLQISPKYGILIWYTNMVKQSDTTIKERKGL